MAAQTLASVVGTQLEKVRSKIPVVFDRDDKFFGFIEKRTDVEAISSRDLRAPLELAPGGSSGGYNPEGGDMGRGTGEIYDKAVINSVHTKHAVEYTYLTQITTNSARKAVVNTVNRLMANAMKEYRRNIDSWCMTDGTGVLGTASAVSLGTGTNGGDVVTLGTDGFGARLLRKQMKLNVYNAALSTRRTTAGEVEVNFYDGPNKIVHTFPSLAGFIATDKLVVEGVSATPPVWINGVPYHHSNASTGTWLGFPRATTPEIRANRVNAGGSFSLPFARLAMNKIKDRVGIDNSYKCTAWMHMCNKDAYEQVGQLVSIINKEAKDQGLNMYFNDNMQLAGAPIRESASWDKTRIDFVTDVWYRVETDPIDYYTVDGRKLFPLRGVSGGLAAGMIFYLKWSGNIGVDNPAACSYIDGLTVLSGY